MSTTNNAPAPAAVRGASGPLLTAFDAIAAKGGDPKAIAGQQFGYIMDQIRSNPLPFYQELRDDRPILQSAAATLVSRFRDVEEILHRETIFSVSPYLPRMMGVIGPFVLSQDITPGYDHDISVMRLVVRREDLARVKEIVSRSAAGIVQSLSQGPGPFDIVQTLTRKVPVRLAAEYYGFDAPDDTQMMGWARDCFREFFINLMDTPDMRAPAVTSGAAMHARLDALLENAVPRAAMAKDDVMGRLLCLQAAGDADGVDDEVLRRTLAGLVIGMVETTSQAAIQALLVLFSMPDALAKAAAAPRPTMTIRWRPSVFEALRYRPINPMVVRVAKEDYQLAAGEPHATVDSQGHDGFRADLRRRCSTSASSSSRTRSGPAGPTTTTCTSPPGCTPASAATSARSRSRRSSSPCSSSQACARPARPEYDGTFPQKLLVSTS